MAFSRSERAGSIVRGAVAGTLFWSARNVRIGAYVFERKQKLPE